MLWRKHVVKTSHCCVVVFPKFKRFRFCCCCLSCPLTVFGLGIRQLIIFPGCKLPQKNEQHFWKCHIQRPPTSWAAFLQFFFFFCLLFCLSYLSYFLSAFMCLSGCGSQVLPAGNQSHGSISAICTSVAHLLTELLRYILYTLALHDCVPCSVHAVWFMSSW